MFSPAELQSALVQPASQLQVDPEQVPCPEHELGHPFVDVEQSFPWKLVSQTQVPLVAPGATTQFPFPEHALGQALMLQSRPV